MTKVDLKLLYQQEIGEPVPDVRGCIPDVKDYVAWLEDKVLSLYNIQ